MLTLFLTLSYVLIRRSRVFRWPNVPWPINRIPELDARRCARQSRRRGSGASSSGSGTSADWESTSRWAARSAPRALLPLSRRRACFACRLDGWPSIIGIGNLKLKMGIINWPLQIFCSRAVPSAYRRRCSGPLHASSRLFEKPSRASRRSTTFAAL